MNKKLWLGIAVTGVCLYFFYYSFRNIDFSQVLNELKKAHYAYILLFIFIQFLVFVLRAERWRHVLEPIKRIKFNNLLKITYIGFTANNVLPLRVGEIAKAYLISRKENTSRSAMLATVLVERVFDLMMVLLFLALAMNLFSFSLESRQTLDLLRQVGNGMLAILICLMAGLFILITKSDRIINYLDNKTTHLASGMMKKLLGILDSFTNGLVSLKKGRNLINISGLSLAIWLMNAIGFYAAYSAFDMHLPFLSAVLLTAALALGVAIPSTPGYVGTYEVACSSVLALLMIRPDKAFSYIIVTHMASMLPVSIVGMIFLLGENVTFSELSKLKENE